MKKSPLTLFCPLWSNRIADSLANIDVFSGGEHGVVQLKEMGHNDDILLKIPAVNIP